MAYRGYGIWALVAQQLSDQFLVTTILWFTVKWRPSLKFSIKNTRELFSFGWKLLVSTLINSICLYSQSLIIGKIYSPAMLGYFSRGQRISINYRYEYQWVNSVRYVTGTFIPTG